MVGVEVEVDEVGGVECGVGDGDRDGGGSSGVPAGLGHVLSFMLADTNSLICLYRYHCR